MTISLRERKKNPSTRFSELVHRKNRASSSSHLRLEELKRYLEIFRLKEKQGLSVVEISRTHEYYKEHGSAEEKYMRGGVTTNTIREVNRDIEKAKRIIKYVERGYFPGNYERGKTAKVK